MPFLVDGQQEVASALMKLTSYRLTIPVECMKLIGWTNAIEIVAELLSSGCVRLHNRDEILPSIQARYKAIQESDAPNKLELLGAMQDRYNALSFYGSKNRAVELTKRVVAHLDVPPDSTVFVEGSKEAIHVMSLAYRGDRLERTKHDTSV